MTDRIQNTISWLTIVFELIALFFVIAFWGSLQTGFHIDSGNVVAMVLFGHPLILGFLRALIICMIPVIVLLIFAFALKILYSKTTKLGPVEFGEVAENLNEADLTQKRLEENLRESSEEKKNLREIIQILAEMLRK